MTVVYTVSVGTMSSSASLVTALRVIECQAMRDARAAIVAHHRELAEAQLSHDLHLVGGHRALGICLVADAARRLAAVTVTAQVGRDDRVVPGEFRRYMLPLDA